MANLLLIIHNPISGNGGKKCQISDREVRKIEGTHILLLLTSTQINHNMFVTMFFPFSTRGPH